MAAVLASTPPPSSQRPPTSTHIPPRPFSRHARPTSTILSPTLHSSSPSPPSASTWSFEQRMRESLAVLDLMESQSIHPDPSLFCTLIKACSDEGSIHFGRTVHQRVLQCGLLHDIFVSNSLVAMYAKCGMLGVARQLFDEMPERNVVSWTTVISMYHHAGFPHDALDLYRLMKAQAGAGGARPNAFTYTIALNSCAKVGDLDAGMEVHEDVKRDGCDGDEFVVAALIDMYAKCDCVDGARRVFDAVPNPTAVACTAMIEGYNANGRGKEALEIFRRVARSGLDAKFAKELGMMGVIKSCSLEMAVRQGTEIHAYMLKRGYDPGLKAMTHLVELYEKCDRMAIANRLFNGLAVKSVALWGRMMAGFARNGMYNEALKAYPEVVPTDAFAVCCALQACSELLSLEEGRQIHGRTVKLCNLGLEDSLVDALFEMYRKCSDHESANKITKCRRKPVDCCS